MPNSALHDRDLLTILGALNVRGLASSKELQESTGKSQATVSRLLAELSGRVLVLGQGRARRYGLAKSIRGLPAQQPLYWVDESGCFERVGTLSLLSGDVLHVDLNGHNFVTKAALPWVLEPLRAQGFLGRLLAQHLSTSGLESDPERWPLESVLYAALHVQDAPGAIALGDPADQPPTGTARVLPSCADDVSKLTATLDQLSFNVAKTLPAGSSAGGEQPKFLARQADGTHVLVKFTPPRGTAFGERWHDLLHAEALALDTLRAHGIATAGTRMVCSATRTYLLSERFDRLGATGRRHVVSVGAAHAGFVADAYQSWPSTCSQLAAQQQLSKDDAAQAEAVWHFGRLIGNTDMHSGNLSLFVDRSKLARPRFHVAPIYDMLPMRWRPDMVSGAADYSAFEPNPFSLQSAARNMAQGFWSGLAECNAVSNGLRDTAQTMLERS